MFVNKYPYTDFHELNLDYVLKELEKFRARLDEFKVNIIDEVLEDLEPEINSIRSNLANLEQEFIVFKNDVIASQIAFEDEVNTQLDQITHDFELLSDHVNVLIEQTKLYSDIKDEELYNQILEDIRTGLINIKVVNYITGELMTIQDMFDYLCMFHLGNPITYTQLALKNKTYNELIALNITYTDLIVNGNILIN